MPDQDLCPSLQQCQKKTARWPGTWRLAPQRAISLMPRQASQILIVQGCAWVTWEVGALQAPAADRDVFLMAGQVLDVPAGVRLVMESLDASRSLDFDWRVMPPDLQHRSRHAGPPLSLLARQWLSAWLQLGWTSARLLEGLARQMRTSRAVQPPGSAA